MAGGDSFPLLPTNLRPRSVPGGEAEGAGQLVDTGLSLCLVFRDEVAPEEGLDPPAESQAMARRGGVLP